MLEEAEAHRANVQRVTDRFSACFLPLVARHLETQARADVLLIDKTGAPTLGKPQITDVIEIGGKSKSELLALPASAEHCSAVRRCIVNVYVESFRKFKKD